MNHAHTSSDAFMTSARPPLRILIPVSAGLFHLVNQRFAATMTTFCTAFPIRRISSI